MINPLFTSAIRNLLHINVFTDPEKEECLQHFEDSFCYNPQLQPMFLKVNMSKLLSDLEDGILYQFRDSIGICLLLLRIDGEDLLIGPFVRREFDPVKILRVMFSLGMPASFEESLRLYYSNFPLCGMTKAIDTVLALMKTFWPVKDEYRLARIDNYPKEQKLPKEAYSENLDYSAIYRRYDVENQFLHCIETGDTENVLLAYKQMGSSENAGKRYTSSIYQDPGIGFAMLRTLVRKAAENGGASVVDIDEITQRALQHSLATQDPLIRNHILQNMVLELTEAVEEAQTHLGNYSLPIRKVVEIIRHNYSQSLTLPFLASQAGLSPSHLSRSFSKEVGMTISQYVTKIRCDQAASMLSDTDIPIQQIAAYVGYLDNNYFVKVFKKESSMTPSQYRTNSLLSKK